MNLLLVPADEAGRPGLVKRGGEKVARRGRPPEIIVAPSDEESDAPSMSGASGRVTSPMSRRASWLEFSTPPTSETHATSRKGPGPLELLAAKEAGWSEAGQDPDQRSMWLEGLASRDMEFQEDNSPPSARSRSSQRSSNASHPRSVGSKSRFSEKSAGASEAETDTAINAFNLSIRDMADHIEAFELVAKGKGYITWRDIKSTMESTLQHKVSEGEAKALVQGVTGSAGRPMNLFDFIRFATTSSTNFMYSVQPVVLHL